MTEATTKKVYLAGAIFGLPDRGQEWREQAIALLPQEWEAINPNVIELDKTNPHELVRGDYKSILSCDAVIARVRNPSWGTAMELQFAKWCDTPVIGWPFLRSPVSAQNYSPWLICHVNRYCSTLFEAIGALNDF